jgi:hypothetical protein
MSGAAVVIPFSSNVVWSASSGLVFSLALAGDAVLEMPTGLTPNAYVINVYQDTSGGHKLTFAAGYRARLGVLPVMTSSPGAHDILTLVSDGLHIDVSVWPNLIPL